jgi:hypothetical protein
MKKMFLVGCISFVLITTVSLTSCEKEPEIEYGSLTVMNLPEVSPTPWAGITVYWFATVYFNEEITNYVQLHNWTLGNTNEVACVIYEDKQFNKSTSTFSLTDRQTMDGFSKTGNYLVVINRADYNMTYVMSNVHFTKGKATIDFNDMSYISR